MSSVITHTGYLYLWSIAQTLNFQTLSTNANHRRSQSKQLAQIIAQFPSSEHLDPTRHVDMCTVQYIIYACDHWIPKPTGPDGGVLRICRQAEEERLGFACPQTQRVHEAIDRSHGMCKDCMWGQISR